MSFLTLTQKIKKNFFFHFQNKMVFRRSSKKRSYARRSKKAYRKRSYRRTSRVGVINLVRKAAECNVYNTAVVGTTGVSGSCVSVGTAYQAPPFAGVGTYYNVPFAIQCRLNDLLSFTELTAIAEKYKIKWIKVSIIATSNTASTGSGAQLPSIIYDMDGDDAVLPLSTTAGLNSFRERMSSKVKLFRPNSPINMFVRPKIAMATSTTAGAITASQVSPSKFLDCSFVDVPHFGIKGYLQDVNLATTASVFTQFKFNISMGVTLREIV